MQAVTAVGSLWMRWSCVEKIFWYGPSQPLDLTISLPSFSMIVPEPWREGGRECRHPTHLVFLSTLSTGILQSFSSYEFLCYCTKKFLWDMRIVLLNLKTSCKDLHMSKNMPCLLFWVWVSSLSVTLSSSKHLVGNLIISVSFTSELHSTVCRYHTRISHSSAGRIPWLSTFPAPWTNETVVNMDEQVSLQQEILFLEYIPGMA